MGKTLIVYDFDWSFVDQDTDRWVFEVLDTQLRRLLQTNKTGGGSQCHPDVVDKTMAALAEKGYTKEQILDALRILPVHPAMKRAVLGLRERNPEVTYLCLSNSNTVYIDTILKHHGLTDLFTEIITNPASWDEKNPNRLNIGRRHPADKPPHNCEVGCLVNMCKGAELDAWVAAHGGKDSFDKIVYVGDGENDFCPILRMREGDWACVRKGFTLQKRIERDGKAQGLKADVKLWDQAWEIDEYYQDL